MIWTSAFLVLLGVYGPHHHLAWGCTFSMLPQLLGLCAPFRTSTRSTCQFWFAHLWKVLWLWIPVSPTLDHPCFIDDGAHDHLFPKLFLWIVLLTRILGSVGTVNGTPSLTMSVDLSSEVCWALKLNSCESPALCCRWESFGNNLLIRLKMVHGSSFHAIQLSMSW